MQYKNHNKKGFTLIELLVVIAIIGLLSSIVLVSLESSRSRARFAQRNNDIIQIRTALETYYADNGHYPQGFPWRSECSAWGPLAPSNVIPGLIPKYISKLPSDPQMDKVGNTYCYLYLSEDGTGYKFLIYNGAEIAASVPINFADWRSSAWQICSGSDCKY